MLSCDIGSLHDLNHRQCFCIRWRENTAVEVIFESSDYVKGQENTKNC